MRSIILCILSFSMQLSYGQWDLQRCIDHALSNNISVQQAELDLEMQKNNLQQSKLSRYPSLNGGISQNFSIGYSIDPFTNTFKAQSIQSNSFSLNSGVSLFSFNRIGNTIKANEYALEGSNARLQIAQNQTSWAVVFAYLQILNAEDNLRISEEQLKLSEEQEEQAAILVKSGASNQGALLNARSQLAADRMQRIQAQNQLQLAYLNMMNLLQIEEEEFLITKPELDALPDLPMESVAEIYDLALNNQPEMREAEQRLLQADHQERSSRSAYYPTLSAFGNLNTFYSESGGEFVQTGSQIIPIGIVPSTNEEVLSVVPVNEYIQKSYNDQLRDNFGQSIGLSLSIPIFNNGRTQLAVENAKLNSQIQELNKKMVINQLRSDITTAYTDMLAARSTYESALASEEAQAQNYHFAQERFKAGMLNSTDLFNAKNMWTRAQLQLNQSKYDYLIRHMLIEFYKGNPIKL